MYCQQDVQQLSIEAYSSPCIRKRQKISRIIWHHFYSEHGAFFFIPKREALHFEKRRCHTILEKSLGQTYHEISFWEDFVNGLSLSAKMPPYFASNLGYIRSICFNNSIAVMKIISKEAPPWIRLLGASSDPSVCFHEGRQDFFGSFPLKEKQLVSSVIWHHRFPKKWSLHVFEEKMASYDTGSILTSEIYSKI